MKKFFAILLTLSLGMSMGSIAFAAEPSAGEFEGEILVVVNSQEEFSHVVEQIERENEYAQQLWEKAVKESELPENSIPLNSVVPYATSYYTSSADKSEFLGLRYVTNTFEATYSKAKNASGGTIIGTVKEITAYTRNSANGLTIVSKNYRLIDTLRTIAANYSCRVRVYDSSNGTSNTYSRQYYVEFHVTGSAKVY